jgi:hypothetical protein
LLQWTVWILLLIFFAVPANHFISKLTSHDWDASILRVFYLLPKF